MCTDLDKRMKEYESVSDIRLVNRMPIIIRIDGVAHHTFTKGFKKPFDPVYSYVMEETLRFLCEHIQCCVIGYTQSDEITLALVNYKNLETSPWFSNRVQKICSVTASMATYAFNKYYEEIMIDMNPGITLYPYDDEVGKCELEDFIRTYGFNPIELLKSIDINTAWQDNFSVYRDYHKEASGKGKVSLFDARCFNVPKEDVTNSFYWRQLDAIRNSIQMVGQANFSHKELQNKSCKEIQKMLSAQKSIDWNDLPITQQRGCCCIKEHYEAEDGQTRSAWAIDNNIPLFKGEGRKYIDDRIFV